MKREVLFYIKNNRDGSIWAITKYDTKDGVRLGWLNGHCINVGRNEKIYIGADIGIDAEFVFTSPDMEVSKSIELITQYR